MGEIKCADLKQIQSAVPSPNLESCVPNKLLAPPSPLRSASPERNHRNSVGALFQHRGLLAIHGISLSPSLSLSCSGRSSRVAGLMAPVRSLSVRLPICISSWWSCSQLSRGPFHLPHYTECSLRHRPKRPWCLNTGLSAEPGPE